MSSRYRDGSHYENHERAAELENNSAHVHQVAEQHGQQPHLTGHEHSRQSAEHFGDSHSAAQNTHTVGHGIAMFGHAEISNLAYELWQARGCPEGSPEEDWYRAAEELRSRVHTG